MGTAGDRGARGRREGGEAGEAEREVERGGRSGAGGEQDGLGMSGRCESAYMPDPTGIRWAGVDCRLYNIDIDHRAIDMYDRLV